MPLFNPFLFWWGSPTKVDRKKWYPSANLSNQDLANSLWLPLVRSFGPSVLRQASFAGVKAQLIPPPVSHSSRKLNNPGTSPCPVLLWDDIYIYIYIVFTRVCVCIYIYTHATGPNSAMTPFRAWQSLRVNSVSITQI